jgi:hypothetical protein
VCTSHFVSAYPLAEFNYLAQSVATTFEHTYILAEQNFVSFICTLVEFNYLYFPYRLARFNYLSAKILD